MTYLACFRMRAAILSRRTPVQLACFSICALSWWVVIRAFIDKVAQLSSTHSPFWFFFSTFLCLLIETNRKTQNFLFDYCNFLCNAAKLRDAGEAGAAPSSSLTNLQLQAPELPCLISCHNSIQVSKEARLLVLLIFQWRDACRRVTAAWNTQGR